ncbi:MAG: hypothetical protein QF523_00955, partial [Acidimicrobiales bacterium]|nr:hypothetical protein [Acidimicrobiales bacterium]
LTELTLGSWATDSGGKEGISMNGAGNIVGLVKEVVPAAEVVRQMAQDALACLDDMPPRGAGAR